MVHFTVNAWDVGHTVLGRSAMMLSVLNAILGIYIFVTGNGGDLLCIVLHYLESESIIR
jgi:hypothetical protein